MRRAMVSLNSACVAGAEPGSPLSDEEAMQTAVSRIPSHARAAVSEIGFGRASRSAMRWRCEQRTAAVATSATSGCDVARARSRR